MAAHTLALRQFGSVEQHKDDYRDRWGSRYLETLRQDIRGGVRIALSRPAASLAVIVAMALGIANLLGWPAWTGFLIMALLLCIGGYFTLSSGRKQLASVHAVPEETVTTLKENSEWIAKRLSSVRK